VKRLSQSQKDFLRLIMRSPDEGDGWRRVSRMLGPIVSKWTIPDLCEWEPNADGSGRIRFTDKGETVMEYLA
jgi:hypothetical protein